MNKILRAPWHDYTRRCIYMVTLTKSPFVKDFGVLAGDWRIPAGQPGSSFVSTTPIGSAVKKILRQFYSIEPNVRILQYALMPDHLHILLFVEEPTVEPLGYIIARFKVALNKCVGINSVFSKGFNDQILKTTRSLDILFHYLRENPRRLAVRRANPGYFRRINSLQIGDKSYRAYGNFQLLECPFKEQVIVHRADTPDIRSRNRDLWLYTAANRGVLVSPFISPAEKAIRAEAEDVGGRIILIIPDAIGERYKPSGSDFALCEEGRMLIVAVPPTESKTLTRAHCMTMNGVAESIAARG